MNRKHAEHKFDEILRELRKIHCRLDGIEAMLRPKVSGFADIEQENPMVALDPGATGAIFSTSTLPVGSTLPTPPVWTVDDANITLSPNTADPTGLSIGVSIAAAAIVGESFMLTITGTNADGATATQSNSFTVGAAPVVDVTGFAAITQTA